MFFLTPCTLGAVPSRCAFTLLLISAENRRWRRVILAEGWCSKAGTFSNNDMINK